MRRVWVVVCGLALIGAALVLSSQAPSVEAAVSHPRHAVPVLPTPPTRKSPTPVPITAPSPAAQSQTTPAPTPTPPPPPQVINLTPTQASPGQSITVSGSGFPPGTRVQLYLDGPDHPLGPSVVIAGDGTFSSTETVPAGATVDLHQICAQVNTTTPTCAQLQVTAAPTPTPAATPTPAPTPATPAPTPVPTPHATPRPASNGLLSSLFPWILIPIAILVALAVLGIVLLVRGRRSRGQGGAPLPPVVFGDPRGGGQPTVTHRSPRGYQPSREPSGAAPRGYYRRQGINAPPRGEPLPPGGERPGLRQPGYGNPELPGGGPESIPPDERGRLGGGGPRSLPPSGRPPRLPPRDEDDDDPFSTPPAR